METELIKFYEKLTYLNSKEICKYEDEKGNVLLLPLGKLVAGCEYAELDEAQFKMAVYNKQVDKNLTYDKTTITRVKDKYEITNKPKDKGTLVDSEVEVSRIWFVKNGMGMVKSYNSKEEAINKTKEINDIILDKMEVLCK